MEIAIDMAGLLDMIISHSGAIPASRPAVYRVRGAAKEALDTRDKWVVYFPTEVLNRAQLTQGVADAIREERLADVTDRVASSLFHSIRPIENWGLMPYFSFRSFSEQSMRNDPDWS